MSSLVFNTIAIRREDLSKKGEKRVAVAPFLVNRLSQLGLPVLIQPGIHPSGVLKRAIPDQAYTEAGGTLSEDISSAKVIFGLKEIDPALIHPNKTWVFFSHTHKGQKKNRKMLKSLVENHSTLLDYELITNDVGVRTVTAFTYFAGYAGMIDTLWTLGKRWAMDGIPNLFEKVPQSIEKEDLELIRGLLKDLGTEITQFGTPSQAPPVIVAILGDGKTSIGAQSILDILPFEIVQLHDLPFIFEKGDRRKIYKCVLNIPGIFRLKDSASALHPLYHTYSDGEKTALYLKNPHEFETNLDGVLPYITVLMNCILWSPDYPRTLSRDLMRTIWSRHRYLKAIGDITCDPEGSIEFSKETWIDNPVYIYDPANDSIQDGFEGEGVAVMAVTNLPCEFSADASAQFSRDLEHIIEGICTANFNAPDPESSGMPAEAVRSCILWKGRFTPAFSYMQAFLED